MTAVRSSRSQRRAHPVEATLWELVWAVSEVTDDDREIVATVDHWIASGRVRLCGTFRDDPHLRS